MKLLVSACLLGVCCRYKGTPKPYPAVIALGKKHQLIPVCPEQLGGLPTPRHPSEQQGNRVVMDNGSDVTAQYQRGAQEALHLAKLFGCEAAIMKERSPSCGSGEIYDGTFTQTLTAGDGITAKLLKENGIPVYGESQIEPFL